MSPPRQQAQSSQQTAPMIQHAIVRDPGPDAATGLTTQSGAPLCFEKLQHQHAAYCDTLAGLGAKLIRLDPAPRFPDAYFVEDTAVVTPEIAVIARSGAMERRGETRTVARVLGRYRELSEICAPGTLDGGDVMIVGRQVFIGLSRRTNRQGADQLARTLTHYAYQCKLVAVDDGLHLKSSVTSIGGRQLLLIASWAHHPAFDGYDKILVDPSEAHACNTLWINNHLIIPQGYPQTRALLKATGKPLIELPTGQIRRMDGGLTCLSIRL
jgi:dimethylargininase